MLDIKEVEAEKDKSWLHNKWRPLMGWTYMIICLADFMIIPLLYMFIQLGMGVAPDAVKAWAPITLASNGLFHMSMLSIVGVTAYGRTKEKIRRLESIDPVQQGFNNIEERAG